MPSSANQPGWSGTVWDMSTAVVPSPTAVVERRRGVWAGVRAAFGAVLGLVPHLLHHVGLLAGTAVLTGAVGSWVLYVVGLVLSIPMLRRLRRRFGSAWAPGVGVVVFTGLFMLSAFVIGPAIGDGGTPPPADPVPTEEHELHH